MDCARISGTAGAQGQTQYTAGLDSKAAAQGSPVQGSSGSTDGKTLYEMMREAKEKIGAHKDQLKAAKPKTQYGDVPMLAYSRLARAKNRSQVNAAAGYARRQIARLKAAKYTDSDNAKQIQAAINQLQKAVTRAGKKNRDLDREKLAENRQKKLEKERRTSQAKRERLELRRKQALRAIRESGYIREAEVDKRMQAHIAATQAELRNQAQALSAAYQPSPEAVAQEYAANASAGAEIPASEMDIQA